MGNRTGNFLAGITSTITPAGPPMRLEAWEKAAFEDRFDPPDEYDNAPVTGNSTASRLRRCR
ncbi:hypothetical protein PoMZ_09191 [Pyricularia oryzae]|uniref:Uncharacterized protein n=1 Tax=Pyricularia oryzae TaxID=318829 RepID=A0A4P7MTC3_PYROR|nr:hypothetical protein PoMZ_09191 [Pyricularia oryzae]